MGAWLEEKDVILPLDPTWNVVEYQIPRRKDLTDRDILDIIQSPIASKSLLELARSRKKVAIVVDDISRPTPANKLLPHVFSALHDAGVEDHQVRIVIAVGAHRPLSEKEISLKFGQDIAGRYKIRNHCFAGDSLKHLGVSCHGVPITMDDWVAEADLKIGIGSIIPHDAAGYSGGGKLLVPGVSGFATLLSLHALFEKRGRGILENTGRDLDFRDCIESIAHHVGLDFIINCVVGQGRELVGLFAGDMIEAYKRAASFAESLYTFQISKKLAEETDIVLFNSYPLDVDPDQLLKAAAPAEVFPNAQVVLFNAALDETMYRGINLKSKSLTGKKGYRAGRTFLPRQSGRRKIMIRTMIRKSGIVPLMTRINPVYKRLRSMQKDYDVFKDECKQRSINLDSDNKCEISSRDDLVVVSGNLCETDFYQRFPDGLLFKTWEDAQTALNRYHRMPRVVALHSSTLQIPMVV